MAIWMSSKLYDLKSMLEVEPKLKNVPYSKTEAARNLQMFLSDLMISHVFNNVVFYCSAPAEGRFSGFYLIKNMISRQLTTEVMKYLE